MLPLVRCLLDNFHELLARHSEDYALPMSDEEVRIATLQWLVSCCETADTENRNAHGNSILIVSKVYGIMTKDKLGNAKSFDETLHWMRRCAEVREKSMRNKRDTATERVCDADGASACYRACAHDLLQKMTYCRIN